MVNRDTYLFKYLQSKGYNPERYWWADGDLLWVIGNQLIQPVYLDEGYILFVYESL